MDKLLEQIPGLIKVKEAVHGDEFQCEQIDFENICYQIQNNFSYVWLLDIVVVEREEGNLLLKYILVCFDTQKIFSIFFHLPKGQSIKSVSHLWRNAMGIEQEIWELYGVDFSREYNRKYPFKFSSPPMRKEFKEESPIKLENEKDFQILVKPERQIGLNQFELKVDLSKNLIDRCEVTNGSYHIGFEKIIEGESLGNTFNLLEAYFPVRSTEWSLLLAKGVESANDWEIPPRARAIRMVLLELSRIYDHVQFLTQLSFELKMESFYSQCLLWTRMLQSILVSYSGNEYGANSVRPGGVVKDITQVWLSRTLKEVHVLEKSFLTFYKNVIKGTTVKENLNFPLISKNMANLWCVTGPLARAVGLNIDFRKTAPFYYYSDVEFDVPIGVKGSGYDLLIIRLEEVFQSFKIIVQVLDNLPTGSILIDEFNPIVASKQNLSEEEQAMLRSATQKFMKVEKDFFTSNLLEGSDGALNLTIDFSNQQVNRLKLGTQSFVLKTLFEKVSRGRLLSTLTPLWTVFDVNLKEVER